MDPASGKIVSIIKMTARAGTAYDGRHLYQLAGPSIQKVDPRSERSWPRCQRPPKAARAWPGPRARCGWRITASARSTRSTRPRARSCAPSPRTATSPASPGPTAACGTAPGKTTKASCAASRPKPARCRRACSCPGRLRLRAGSGRRRVLRRQHQRQDPRRAPARARVRKPLNGRRRPNPAAALPGWRHGRPPLGAGPGRRSIPRGIKRLPAPSARRPLGPLSAAPA